MPRHRLAAVLAAVVCCVSCGRTEAPAQRYGFVARLGRDTVSVESVTRRGDRVTVEGVDRFPRVRRRHTEIDLDADGGVRRLVMDIRTPSEPENERERRVEVEVTADSVRITKQDRAGTLRRQFAARDTVVLAHVPQMYSLYDLYFAAARRRVGASRGDDTVRMRQFYVDREFDRFSMHDAVVRLMPDGRAEIWHDWLAGVGAATLDSAGGLRTYSGARTTYDVTVERVADVAGIDSIAARFAAAEAAGGGARQLSVRDTVLGTIGGASLSMHYGRPLLRGRTLLGGLLPYERVWRTGANEATHFTTSAPITLAGLAVPAGQYTLWTIPRRTGAVDLVVNRQTGQWGTSYNRGRDLGAAPMRVDTLAVPVEQFTMSIVPEGDGRGLLRLEWGTFRWTAPIVAAGGAGAPR